MAHQAKRSKNWTKYQAVLHASGLEAPRVEISNNKIIAPFSNFHLTDKTFFQMEYEQSSQIFIVQIVKRARKVSCQAYRRTIDIESGYQQVYGTWSKHIQDNGL